MSSIVNSKHPEFTHHGEYKVPGGKLVVADLVVAGERIERAMINGDFFLEPDEALADINGAIEGLDASASHSSIVAAIEAGLREDAVMFGFDAHAVARGAAGVGARDDVG